MSPSLEEIVKVSKECNLKVKELALKFLLQSDLVDRVIVGTTNRTHLKDDIRIASGDALAPDVVKKIETLLDIKL